MPDPVTQRFFTRLLIFMTGVFCCTMPFADADKEVRTGGWRLGSESSPYLLMHAENPVEWYPWGEAAFARARSENKPIFISIGYFTCHWCHVMERESFQNPEIAALLNKSFISIKVDREQRPDVDAVYMNYVTITRGQGGWPMSVWATPEGKPFLGGTYYPPEARLGRTGLRGILQTLAVIWRDDEEGVRDTAESAVVMLQRLETSATPLERLSESTLVEARKEFRESHDEFLGGFGPAPKFPQPARLMFLLEDEAPLSAEMALRTLDRMAAGGIHDQLEGGFHRYSTDLEWRVPHFEKMLYDQALIARAYLFAYRRTKDPKYAEIARRTIDFTLQHMRDANGGFYSALSADSAVAGEEYEEKEEGAFYTWTWEQFTAALGEGGMREWAAARYGVTVRGNALSDPLGEMAGKNVLYDAQDIRALSDRFNLDLLTAGQRNRDVEQQLLGKRRTRPAVPLDDKIVTVWNGYMLTTLALAGRLLDEERYLEAAAGTAGFILSALYDGKKEVLYRDWRRGVRGVPGFSEDYAALAEGLLTLYKAGGGKHWLAQARRLVAAQQAAYWDDEDGGYFSTRADTELWMREKNAVDGATLSANGIAIHVLLALRAITGEDDYYRMAWRTGAWAGAQLESAAGAMPYILIKWPELLQRSDDRSGTTGEQRRSGATGASG